MKGRNLDRKIRGGMKINFLNEKIEIRELMKWRGPRGSWKDSEIILTLNFQRPTEIPIEEFVKRFHTRADRLLQTANFYFAVWHVLDKLRKRGLIRCDFLISKKKGAILFSYDYIGEDGGVRVQKDQGSPDQEGTPV